MDRKTSIQDNQHKLEESEIERIDPRSIIDVRIRRTETIATRGISFVLMTDPEMCQRIVRELKPAIVRIKEILEDMNDYRLSNNLCSLIIHNRSKLNRFTIVQSDCYWVRMDSDLSQALNMLDECHNVLIRKFQEDFKLSDLLYMIKVLETLMEEFEKKVEQIEEIL